MIKDKYFEYQLNYGHLGLCVEEKAVFMHQDIAFFAASVDSEVHDPCNTGSPVGNLEMKYKLFPEKVAPESNTRLLVTLATKTNNFCLELTDSGLRLKRKHPYYSQVQGRMALRRMQWWDFFSYKLAQIHLWKEHANAEEEGLGTITKKHPFSLQQQTKLMTGSLLFLQAIGLHVLLLQKNRSTVRHT